MTPTAIADTACNTGENPLWHPDENAVYWTDIPAGALYRLDWATGRYEQIYSGEPVGGFTLQVDGSLILFKARGAVELMRGADRITLIESLPLELESRFNDVIATPGGRVFAGTMPSPTAPGRLYRIDPDLSVHVVFDGIGCSNGMGFTGDLKRFYYTDSAARTITRYDFDDATGALSNPTPFLSRPEISGAPDGMTVDCEDHVWVAYWDGNCLARYSPDGVEVMRIDFPVRKVSSLSFGGPTYEDIFVTTAGGHIRVEDGELAGSLFHLKSPVKGRPEFRSTLGLAAP
jgi:D-xylonolactonase